MYKQKKSVFKGSYIYYGQKYKFKTYSNNKITY